MLNAVVNSSISFMRADGLRSPRTSNHVKEAGGDDVAELKLGLNVGEPHLRLHRPENGQFQAHRVLLSGLGIEAFGGVHGQDPKSRSDQRGHHFGKTGRLSKTNF